MWKEDEMEIQRDETQQRRWKTERQSEGGREEKYCFFSCITLAIICINDEKIILQTPQLHMCCVKRSLKTQQKQVGQRRTRESVMFVDLSNYSGIIRGHLSANVAGFGPNEAVSQTASGLNLQDCKHYVSKTHFSCA